MKLESTSNTFETIVGLANIVGAVIAALALIATIGLGTAWVQTLWFSQVRWVTIGRPLREIVHPSSDSWPSAPTGRTPRESSPVLRWLRVQDERGIWHRRFFDMTHHYMRQRVETGGPTAAQELSWLGRLLGDNESEPVTQGALAPAVPVAFTFSHRMASANEDYMDLVARMYERYAATVRRKWLLRTASGRLAAEEYETARRTARILSEAGRHKSSENPPDRQLSTPWVDLAPGWDPMVGRYERQTRMLAMPDSAAGSTAGGFASLATSYVPFRVSVAGAPGSKFADGRQLYSLQSDEKSTSLDMRYDGIMSRLHGAPGYRVERDIHSGRQRLHLCISETTYSSFVRTQALPNNPSQLGKHAFFSRLISVNLLMLDNDDRVLMVRRHRDIAHPGRYAGAVSGACELVGRGGIDADLDTNGFPDLLATCRREAKEELGVDLDAREWALSALGLIQVHDFRDALTYVLVATARSPRPVSEFRVRVGSTDDLEGTWEVDDQALVVDLHAALSGADSLEEFVDWLRTSEELTAHGAGSLLLQSNVYLMRRDPGLGPVLAQAAAAPLPDERPRTRPRWVTSQPLWTTDRA